MTSRPAPYQKPTESNSPLGMSKFSIRRYSVQHVILLFLILSLITAMNVYALREGETLLMALAAVTPVFSASDGWPHHLHRCQDRGHRNLDSAAGHGRL